MFFETSSFFIVCKKLLDRLSRKEKGRYPNEGLASFFIRVPPDYFGATSVFG